MNGPRRIALDANATGPVDPRVLERFVEVERAHPANPDSLHAPGRAARARLEAARAQAAAALGRPAGDVLFVASGTEANNLAIAGLGDPALPVLAADLEHVSVLAPAERRGRVALAVGRDGFVVPVPPARPVGLVAIVHAQSELGTVQPVESVARLAREAGVPLHVDCAQTLGRIPLGPIVAVADTIAFSTHKAGGLRGGSLLLARGGPERLRPLWFGGGQEGGVRPGTPSIALAAATALAVELAVRECDARAAAMRRLRDLFLDEIRDCPGLELLTREPALPNTLLVRCHAVDGRLLLPALDVAGIAASQGSACSSGSPQPPRVLHALGLDAAAARQCVRFSLAAETQASQLIEAARILRATLARMSRTTS